MIPDFGLVISNGSVVSPTAVVPDASVRISNGRIAFVGPAVEDIDRPATFLHQIDAEGGFICPGFIDLHVNGGGGRDITEGSEEAVSGIAKGHVQCGTTGFLVAVTGPTEEIAIRGLQAARAVSERRTGGARLLGVHMEGPFVNPQKQGPVFRGFPKTTVATAERFAPFLEAGAEVLRIVTLAPEIPGVIQLFKQLVDRGIRASIGHSEATPEEVRAAIAVGASYCAHIFNAMGGFDHREPGAAVALLNSPTTFSVELIADGHHVHPEAVALLVAAKGIESTILVSDATEIVGSAKTSFVLPIGDGFRVDVRDGRTWGPEGQLIGSVLQMNHAIRNVFSWLNYDLPKVVCSATLRPAEILGMDDELGSLEPGKMGDVTVLSRDFEVLATIVGGEVVYQRSELSA